MVSRTKMKLSVTETPATFAGTHGHAQHYHAMIALSTTRKLDLEKLTLVAIVEKTSTDPDRLLAWNTTAMASHRSTSHFRTARSGFSIYTKSISSEIATLRRNFTGQITSGNI